MAVVVSSGTVRGDQTEGGLGLIRLPVGEPVHMTYVGEELWHDNGIPGIVDAGDVFEGIAIVDSIKGVNSGVDYSQQLRTRELTVAFRFTVTAGAHNPAAGENHIEFSLEEGDYFRLYVGVGKTKNYDPLATNSWGQSDAWRRATDGNPWIAIEPGIFFASVNDIQSDYSTLNRAWTDLTTNQTKFCFQPTLFFEDSYVYDGEEKDAVPVQLYFENFIGGFSEAFPAFTFAISGDIYMQAELNDPVE